MISVERKMEEISSLSDLANYTNVGGEKAVNRRVEEETTRLERLEDREEEWHMDVLTLR